jgi:hypothetical protein
MATHEEKTQAGAEQDTGLSAVVNGMVLVTVFDSAGTAVQVPPETADLLVSRHGFKRHKVDIASAVSAFKALFGAASHAIGAYVDGVTKDGYIDTSDEAAHATAAQAMRLIEESWHALNLEIARTYPVRQGEGATLYERRATVILNGAPLELSVLDLAARRQLEPENAAYAEQNVVYHERTVTVDPGQVAAYLATPGWSNGLD